MQGDSQVPDVKARPAFFYHLGDVVYLFGEAKEYYGQFYHPYDPLFTLPIFAIPGNHDGAVYDSSVPSLDAFVRNFCSPVSEITKDAYDAHRPAMIQPNVYWTLEAPFVTIIGLYTNVPEGGQLDQYQLSWFESELTTAPADKALIVTLHHPPCSFDGQHGGSLSMRQMLEQTIQKTGRTPDAVLSGHVHNYQRFTSHINGRDVPFIVAGAGGHWHLYALRNDQNGNRVQTPQEFVQEEFTQGVTLEKYCDDHHGYLRITVTPDTLKGEYVTVPHSFGPWRETPATVFDTFTIDLKQHKLVS
jgi:3',5'-cyclic AMP phosphodiesterase CpdA